MPWITKEGRSVDEARKAAIAESRMDESDLDIEVVNEGAKGLFGLGGEPAVVRVRPKSEATDFRSAFTDDITPPPGQQQPREMPERPDDDDEEERAAAVPDDARALDDASADTDGEPIDEPEDAASIAERQEAAAQLGVEIIRGIVERMDLEGDITTRISGGTVYIEVSGEEMGILIGRSGTTLEALQELVRAGIQRRLKTRQAVVVDVEGYWDRRKPEPRERAPREGGGRQGGGGRGRQGGRGGRRGGGRGRRGNKGPNDSGEASKSG